MRSALRPMSEISQGALREIIEGLADMSGAILWRVTGTWANGGRTGRFDDVVEARTATEAIAIAWGCEDDEDLRTVSAEWLCPIESVKREEEQGSNGTETPESKHTETRPGGDTEGEEAAARAAQKP